VKQLVADETVLNEAVALAKSGRLEFMEQQSRLLAGAQQSEQQPQYVLRVADN
jgi:hypothetical protein